MWSVSLEGDFDSHLQISYLSTTYDGRIYIVQHRGLGDISV